MAACAATLQAYGRGVDGVSHQDLLHLPSSFEASLLTLLERVEKGEGWPQQTRFGVVQAIAKVDGAHEVSTFRPVVVLSLLYRTWSSLRSRQLLAQLVPHLPDGQVGFVPGQEAMNIWAMWMAMIDLCCQGSTTLCGLSSDLIRAFNCIPREPLFWLASFLGIPEMVVVPWRSYLTDFSRSFMIRGSLSEASTSSVGFPEGCALSVLGMRLLDMTWHHYASVFCPGIRIYSYVDNLGLTARDAGHLALGFATMQAFFTLWHMEIDLEKSYCWGIDSASRQALAAFPMKRAQRNNELGGSLSFGNRPRVVDITARMARLVGKWPILARSTASLYQKLVALVVSFWPEGLHGSLACRFAFSHLDGLRRRAAVALGWKLAGSSPSMRFLLCPVPHADPLLWHHRTVLQSFRRLCLTSEDFVAQWRLFWDNYDGTLYTGPYSKVVELLSHIGWSVVSTFWFRDHRGHLRHLLHTPWALVEQLLWDAWARLVCLKFRQRHTARDLGDLDPWLHSAFAGTLGALDRARLSALQAAASWTPPSMGDMMLVKSGIVRSVAPWIQLSIGLYVLVFRDSDVTWRVLARASIVGPLVSGTIF